MGPHPHQRLRRPDGARRAPPRRRCVSDDARTSGSQPSTSCAGTGSASRPTPSSRTARTRSGRRLLPARVRRAPDGLRLVSPGRRALTVRTRSTRSPPNASRTVPSQSPHGRSWRSSTTVPSEARSTNHRRSTSGRALPSRANNRPETASAVVVGAGVGGEEPDRADELAVRHGAGRPVLASGLLVRGDADIAAEDLLPAGERRAGGTGEQEVRGRGCAVHGLTVLRCSPVGPLRLPVRGRRETRRRAETPPKRTASRAIGGVVSR